MHGSFSTLVQSFASGDECTPAAHIARKIGELEERLSAGPLTREDEINIAHSARYVAGLCKAGGLTLTTSSARLARLLSALS